MQQPSYQPDVTSDDRLWSMLAYIVTPIVPIVILLMEDKKNRPFIKSHNVQALVLGIVGIIIASIISAITLGIGGCIAFPALWIYLIILGVKANKGETVTIPVITDFVKNQGW